MSVDEFLTAAEKRVKKKDRVMEVDIESSYVNHAKSVGCSPMKLSIISRRGWPDRTTFCPGGRVLFIEFKRKNKRPSSNQIKIKGMLKSFGFSYHICDEIGQAEDILDNFLLEL